MNIPTIILMVLIAAAVAGAIVGIFRKHRKHKGCCEGNRQLLRIDYLILNILNTLEISNQVIAILLK